MTAFLRQAKGDALQYRVFFDLLNEIIPFAEAMVITALPRGTLQVVQPQRLPEPLLRTYSKLVHADDRLTWQAVLRDRAVHGRESWPADQYEHNPYFVEFLQPAGLAHAAAAPLSAPVLEGYFGALHLYRTQDQERFSDAELSRLESAARELDDTTRRLRSSRRTGVPRVGSEASIPRHVIFDRELKTIFPKSWSGSADARLHERMLEYARFRLGHVNGKNIESDRVSFPDARGDLLHFRVIVHRTYPALGSGPYVFFCLQPPCADWSALRPVDVQAVSDVARLVPAMKFMRDHFHRGPTLTEIARAVQLSPFHFHRRFTEIFGITPKHFMLDCQIEHAKSELLSRQKDLAHIASACGFAHQSHFTSRFKQATGQTPTRWRRLVSDGAARVRA